MTMHGRSGWMKWLIWGSVALTATTVAAQSARRQALNVMPTRSSYGLTGAQLQWRSYIPQRSVDAIEHIDLVDEYIYCRGSNGWVWSIDVRTGNEVWAREVVSEGYTLWQPVSGRRYLDNTVAFTMLTKLEFIDLELGTTELSYRLDKPSAGRIALSRNMALSSEVDQRLRAYNLDDKYTAWMVDTRGELQISPRVLSGMRVSEEKSASPLAFLESQAPPASPESASGSKEELVYAEVGYFADTRGNVYAGYTSDKQKVFTTEVEGQPVGNLGYDEKHLYLATTEQWIYALDRIEGDLLWRMRLIREPRTGPMIVGSHLFVGLREEGMEHIDLSSDLREVTHLENCRTFLAEWPTRFVMLDTDDRIALYHKDTWELADTLAPGRFNLAVSNTINDAVIVGTSRGDLICVRPANSDPLQDEAFYSAELKLALTERAKQQAEEKRESESSELAQDTTPATPAAGSAGADAPENVPPRIEDLLLEDPLRSTLPPLP